MNRKKMNPPGEELQGKIDSQKGHSHEFRGVTGLDPAAAQKISRTGRGAPNRDLKGTSRALQENYDTDLGEEGVSQNSLGGKTNR